MKGIENDFREASHAQINPTSSLCNATVTIICFIVLSIRFQYLCARFRPTTDDAHRTGGKFVVDRRSDDAGR